MQFECYETIYLSTLFSWIQFLASLLKGKVLLLQARKIYLNNYDRRHAVKSITLHKEKTWVKCCLPSICLWSLNGKVLKPFLKVLWTYLILNLYLKYLIPGALRGSYALLRFYLYLMLVGRLLNIICTWLEKNLASFFKNYAGPATLHHSFFQGYG